MKKLMFALTVLLGSAVAVNAQDTNQKTTPSDTETAQPSTAAVADRAQIKVEELPEAVKKTLEDQEYKGWLINTAYHNQKKDQYEVELKNGADTQIIKFSQEGQRLDD